MSTTKHVLVVGFSKVPPHAPAVIAADGEHQPEARIAASIAKAKEEGYELEARLIDPKDAATAPSIIAEKLQSRKWDGYVIGFGVRGSPGYTDLFEQLVNAGREIVPETRMGFNTRPDDLHEAVFRIFGKK